MRRFLPIVDWLPQYDRRWLRGDVAAGIAVTALIVPKNLGYAGIAGVPLRFLVDTAFDGPHERALMRLYEVTWDGPILPQPEEIAWGAFVAFDELDRMLAKRAFCPDSVAIFDRWRDGRLDP